MIRVVGDRKSTDSELLRIENRIKKLIREDEKMKKQIELTTRIGEKLYRIKQEKEEEKIIKKNKLSHDFDKQRNNIAFIRQQISQNIKEQKSRVLLRNKNSKAELDELIRHQKTEAMRNDVIEYANKAMSTLVHFKTKHQKAIQNERIKSYQRSQIRENYISKIQYIERAAKRNKKKIKNLEKVEMSIIDQLKNTTMVHNFVQSKFEAEFSQGLSISSNLGSNSYRAHNVLFNESSQREIQDDSMNDQLNRKNDNEFKLKNQKNNKFNLLFSPASTGYSNSGKKILAPFPLTTKNSQFKEMKKLNKTSKDFGKSFKTRNDDHSTDLPSTNPVSAL